MARLDAIYRPVATKPVDVTDLGAFMNQGDTIGADLARLAVDDQGEAVLRAVIELYAAGDETVRAAVRRLFDRYPSFRWAAHLPRGWDTAEEFRGRLVHLSARDQGADRCVNLRWPRDSSLIWPHWWEMVVTGGDQGIR